MGKTMERLHRNFPKNSTFVAPRCRNSAAPIRSRSSHVLPAATCRLSKAKHVSTTTILYQLQLAYGASKWRTSAWQHLNDWPTPIPLKARFPPKKKNVGLILPFHPCLWRPSVPSSARCNSSPTSSPNKWGCPGCPQLWQMIYQPFRPWEESCGLKALGVPCETKVAEGVEGSQLLFVIHQQGGFYRHFCWGKKTTLFQMSLTKYQHFFDLHKMGGFLKWWYPTTMGFPTKNDHFGVFWGYLYHHWRKHPNLLQRFQPLLRKTRTSRSLRSFRSFNSSSCCFHQKCATPRRSRST